MKSLIRITSLLLVLFIVVACGGDGTSDQGDESKSESSTSRDEASQYATPSAVNVPADGIAAIDAKNFVGETKKVCGQVVSYSVQAYVMMNLDKKFPGSYFTIVISKRSLENFPAPPENLLGNPVCVTGVVAQYDETSHKIDVETPDQIEELQ